MAAAALLVAAALLCTSIVIAFFSIGPEHNDSVTSEFDDVPFVLLDDRQKLAEVCVDVPFKLFGTYTAR